MAYCPKCGEEVKEDYNICPKCGNGLKGDNPIQVTITNPAPKKKGGGCLIPIIIFIILVVVVGSVSMNLEKNENLEITNAKGNVNEFGALVWEGDVTNKGTTKLENVKIEITCYTEAREVAGKAITEIKYIEPGETLHFTASGLGQYNPNLKCESRIK